MLTLLNLLSAIALLVWGTHIVSSGILRVYGSDLHRFLANHLNKKMPAFLTGVGITMLVQSSNATALLVATFVGQKLMALSPALVVLLGADVGTALLARILTFNLSWLSPLFIFFGVVLFRSFRQKRIGQIGRIGIGLGLILLALQLIVHSAQPITSASGVQVIFSSLTGDVMLDALVGAIFAIISYSSLATVLITATLAATHVIAFKVALCLVVGANLGSGLLAMLNSSTANAAGKRIVLGNLLFKFIGLLLVLPFINFIAGYLERFAIDNNELIILFHVVYNILRCAAMVAFIQPMAKLCYRLIPDEPKAEGGTYPKQLDSSALITPTLAMANASRETLRMGDILEQMLMHFTNILHGKLVDDRKVRILDDNMDNFYTAIKLYLARIPKEELPETESYRWAEIIEMVVNLEQAGDIVVKMCGDVVEKAIQQQYKFSAEGLRELDEMLEQLLNALRLSLSLLLSRDLNNAKRLRRTRQRFRLLNRRYSHAHVQRLHQNNVQSIQTSSLHLSLLSDLNRLSSLLCAAAYNIIMQQRTSKHDEG